MSILIIGGVHGDEPSGVSLVTKINQNPIADVHTIIGNPLAVKKQVRFVETDLNRSFGKLLAISREEKRAVELKSEITKYKYVIDFHNTDSVGTSCAIVTRYPNSFHLKVANCFGFSNIVITPPGGSLIGQIPKCGISLEISLNDEFRWDTKFLYEAISRFISSKKSTLSAKAKHVLYKYEDTVGSKVYKRIKHKLGDISDFVPLTMEQRSILGIPEDYGVVCPLFVHYSAGKYSDTVFNIISLLSKRLE